MVRHVVWWEMKPEANGKSGLENAEIIKMALQGLLGQIPSLRTLEVSTEFVPGTTESVNLILSSTHDDAAGLKAYAEDPRHVRIAVELVKPAVSSRRAIDYVF